MSLPDIYVGLGSNLGDPLAMLAKALCSLESLPGNSGLTVSPIYLTSPVSDLPQPDFLNAVCRFKTTLAPHTLFAELQRIEKNLGQLPKPKNAPRLIDLDILFYGDLQIRSPDLEIPHPRWRERLFVLRPLADLTEFVPEGQVCINDLLIASTLDPLFRNQIVKRYPKIPAEVSA